MIVVYVAGPFSANNVVDVLKNIGRGQKMCAKLFKLGFAPFCPWHDRTFITDNPDDDFSVEEFYRYSLEFLKRSDVMMVMSGWENSSGTKKEIEFAHTQKITVCFGLKELIDWSHKNT